MIASDSIFWPGSGPCPARHDDFLFGGEEEATGDFVYWFIGCYWCWRM